MFKYTGMQKTYILSYPKAGRTWFRAIIALCFTDLPLDEAIEITETEKLRSDMPKLAFEHGSHRSPKNFTEFFLKIADHKVFILVRDPRDILVSSYFQETLRTGFYKEKNIHKFLYDPTYGVEAIVKYYNELIVSINNPIIVRYEDLHINTLGVITKFFVDLNVHVEKSKIKKAIEQTRFETMQKVALKSKNHRLQPTNLVDPESQKVRKGKIGNFVEYLNPEDQMYALQALQKLDYRYGYKE